MDALHNPAGVAFCTLRVTYAHISKTFYSAIESLVAVDMDAYGVKWTDAERRRTYCLVGCLILIWICLLYVTGTVLIQPNFVYWGKLIIQNTILAMVFVTCGCLITFYELKENYSRKICHIFAYALPVSLHFLWVSGDKSVLPDSIELTWTCWFQFIPFIALIKPIRRKSSILLLAFRAIDRTQDRPYTLVWMLSQLLGNYISILAFHFYLGLQTNASLVRLALLPMLINVFGDGLAEPVGVRWGKNKYTTAALWYNGSICAGRFERSYEGSACVYVVTLLSLIPFRYLFTPTQFAMTMVLLPIMMTVCEAWAPHTWDNPFLTSVCGAFLIFVHELIP